MNNYRIVLADDHALFRHGLRKILEEAADLEVVGEATDGLDLLALAGRIVLDMVILDVSMPNLRGIEAIPELRSVHPGVKVLVLTMHTDGEYLYEALAAGADGYFLKKDAEAELFSAIGKVRHGGVYVSPSLSQEEGTRWEQMRQAFQRPNLTGREVEILKLVSEGKSSKEIGELLFISVHTVERHRANLMEKLKMKKTADLVKYAIGRGLV
jgi:DNA-binding NarL/FixJ family response regulator